MVLAHGVMHISVRHLFMQICVFETIWLQLSTPWRCAAIAVTRLREPAAITQAVAIGVMQEAMP